MPVLRARPEPNRLTLRDEIAQLSSRSPPEPAPSERKGECEMKITGTWKLLKRGAFIGQSQLSISTEKHDSVLIVSS